MGMPARPNMRQRPAGNVPPKVVILGQLERFLKV